MTDQPVPVVFVGLMATGKTSVADAVAARTGWPVRDSDADIEQRTGRTADQVAEEDGPRALHELEARQLLDAVAARRPGLVAAAASIIDDDRCVVALRSVPVVWLRATLATMLRRFDSRSGRPRFGQEPAELLRGQLDARSPRFADVADLVVDVDDRSVDSIAELVVDRLGLPRSGPDAGWAADR